MKALKLDFLLIFFSLSTASIGSYAIVKGLAHEIRGAIWDKPQLVSR